ncbi:DUF6953 family protein [Acinetobacter haemolyticus]|uniref:Uncharacterized protein n=1 Tax=Acinetobacter haemolyticus TaxID=29430 RepID=A0A4P7B3T3_ACIHA|nr:hypothetical protein [Acinetobacter haemolyticus]QBQ16272.1 hypothetical protein AHTJR_08260 [Acinetobacter haemolyticus]
MTTEIDVANWMKEQLDKLGRLYQEQAVYSIAKLFGKTFVYQNENGNLAISKSVLKEFRKLTEGNAIWERSDKSWRKLYPNEQYKGRQVE